MARFYIAATVSRWQEHNIVRDLLIEAGHTITYDWTQHGDNGNLNGSSPEARARYAKLEAQAIKHADFVVALIPGGNGTNSEVGMTAVLEKPTYLHSFDASLFGPDNCINNFYWHYKAKRCTVPSLEDFAAWVIKEARPKPPDQPGFKPCSAEQAVCQHPNLVDHDRRLPLRYGSHAVERCLDCGAWRTRTEAFDQATGLYEAGPQDWWHYTDLDTEIDERLEAQKEW